MESERKAIEFIKMELPFRLQGLGLRSSEFTNPLAYYSSLAYATICDKEVSRASIPTIADAPAKLIRRRHSGSEDGNGNGGLRGTWAE